MSARLNKKAPQGEAPQTARTDQSFIAGVGLAGTAAATIVLGLVIGLGAASFQIWPDGPQLPGDPAVELEVPAEGAVELPSAGLLASTVPLDLTPAATGAPPRSGGGNGANDPKRPGGGADGGLAPGQSPGTPGGTPPAAEGGGDLGVAGGDADPGNGNGNGNGNGKSKGNGNGNGDGNGNGSGHGKGKGQATKGKGEATEATSTTTTIGGRKGSRAGGVKQGKAK